ncbi:beta strand repeat-containing protein, partial [Flavobacterium sp. FlaQc-57]|uniref:beta strand repeat-containing protein n=1 Tax=Flavobacterium sp. FlaQc-57 TaxID=3374186 RepID=UPI0037567D3D
MRNFTFRMFNSFKLISLVLFLTVTSISSFAQICGTPGVDGPVAITGSVNTYFPINGNVTLFVGAQSILLGKVPDTDTHLNNFGATPISAGDLILIIQMQDATIDYRNNANYGSGTSTSGPDSKGGTGFTNIGNTGVFEYVIATNSVPLAGGNLTFKGTGSNNGVSNSFFNAVATATEGKKTFQVIRVPQYSNLTLNSDIKTPPFNGVAGGVIAFNVSGTFNFNGYKIDGNARGFRGGYSPRALSEANNASIYVANSSNTIVSGKGEGIAGTPRFMWDGFNQVDNVVEGMPGGSAGLGAPANAGGGGNDHNTGGGGGGNGGSGGLGGYGWQGYAGGDRWPNFTGGGRPGSKSYTQAAPPLTRLIMGGGGGAGDANNAVDGVKGGVGGAIILINAGTVQGTGTIEANGGNGAAGVYSGSPDGAGGAGAGGTVLLNISNSSTGAITINAKGGNGGNTERDTNNEHGPGGGGGGGIIRHNIVGTVTITTNVSKGLPGVTTGATNNAGSTVHGAIAGEDGHVSTFTSQDLPANLQVNASCFPILETTVESLSTASTCNAIGEKVSYKIQIKNTGVGNAAGVVLDFTFAPTNIVFDSATATYTAEASGPSGALSNTGTANNPLVGVYNIAQNGVVTITLVGRIATSFSTAGAYSASAQAIYLDPTRTTVVRNITALTNAYGTVNTKYEGASQAPVLGTNFNGNGASVVIDDITISALPAVPTATVTTQTGCNTPTGTITVSSPANSAGISYTLTGTNPVSGPVNNTTGVFPGLVSGTYQVTTTNGLGCTSLPRTGLLINTVANAPTTTGVSMCQNGTGSLTATSTCSSNFVNSGTTISGTWNATTDPTALRPSTSMINSSSCGFDNNNSIRNYVAIPFQVSVSGNYILEMNASSNNDPMGYIVSGAFVPGSCATGNWIKGDDDSAGNRLPRLGASSGSGIMTLNVGTTYTLISTTYANSTGTGTISGTFSWGVTSRPNGGEVMLQTPGTINWYTSPSGGTAIGSGNSFDPVGVLNSGVVNRTAPTSVTFYAECSSNPGCRTATNFVIKAIPTITNTAPASRCDAGSLILGATASSGTINWYAAATGGPSLATGPSFTTPSLSATTSYFVDATDNLCTTGARTEVKATINTTPTINSTTQGSNCGAGTVTLLATASAGATIDWYSSLTGGPSLKTGGSFDTPNLTATTTYYVGASIVSSGCTSTSRIAVTAVINNPSTIALTSGTQNPAVCTGSAIPTTVYTFGGSAANATVTNLPSGLDFKVDTDAKTVTISGTPTTNGTYSITTVGHTAPCTEKTITGTITMNSLPATPTLTITQPTCGVSGKLTINNYSATTQYALDGGTFATLPSATFNVSAGTHTVVAKDATSLCSSGPATSGSINATPAVPSAPTAPGNVTVCETGSSQTLTATATVPAGSSIVWYDAATGGNIVNPATLVSTVAATR